MTDLRIQDPIIAAFEKYQQHPNILKIKKHVTFENYFDFKHNDDKKCYTDDKTSYAMKENILHVLKEY